MDLVAVRQSDKLWTAGGAARMKKARKPATGRWRRLFPAGRPCEAAERAQIWTDSISPAPNRLCAGAISETWDALQNGLHLLGNGGVAVESRHDQRAVARWVTREFRDGINAEKVS